MPWSSGNYTKGNNATGGWTGDASLGIGIEASRHDTQDNDFADGIDQCLNKAGQNAMTGNLNLGGNRPTNIAAGTAAAPAICAGGDVNTGIFSAAVDQIGIATNGAERVRIDDTGRVGIGTSAPAHTLDLVGTHRIADKETDNTGKVGRIYGRPYTNANGDWLAIDIRGQNGSNEISFGGGSGLAKAATELRFITAANPTTVAGTERMRINNAGEVGLGVASIASVRLATKSATSDSTTYNLYLDNSAATLLFSLRSDGLISTGTAATSPYNLTTATAANVVVTSAGFLYRSTSSAKYKTDINPLPYGLAEVMQLRPVTYKGKTDGDIVFGGLIAEEVHDAGLPEFVVYAEDGTPDALAYGNLVSLAFKAIQELNAKVESLEARVAALEGA